jgi:hypothetical protein
MTRPISFTASVGTLLFLLAAPASATPPEGVYAEHVVHCAQTMGFIGDHNPGMHRGYAGWDGMMCY